MTTLSDHVRAIAKKDLSLSRAALLEACKKGLKPKAREDGFHKGLRAVVNQVFGEIHGYAGSVPVGNGNRKPLPAATNQELDRSIHRLETEINSKSRLLERRKAERRKRA